MHFIDYVGMSTQQSPAPVLLLEAKRWGEPWVAARNSEEVSASAAELIVAGLRHVLEGGRKETSPLIRPWHEHLEQVSKYASAIHANGNHELSRLVLSSGDWIVVFTQPATTFVERGRVDTSHIEMFRIAEYIQQGRRIFELLSRRSLADQIPFNLRVGQLGSYLATDHEFRVFHAVHVAYQVTGSELFTPVPRVLVYAAIVFQRRDGMTVAVVDEGEAPLPVGPDRFSEKLWNHLAVVKDNAAALLGRCSEEMGNELNPVGLSEFNGFAADAVLEMRIQKKVVKPLERAPNEWLFVTGLCTHFLREWPHVDPCQFHSWRRASASGNGIGTGAVTTPRVQHPRTFVVDGEAHHCAHQVVVDRRYHRCQITVLDRQVCCRACAYENVCWTDSEIARLPCGT